MKIPVKPFNKHRLITYVGSMFGSHRIRLVKQRIRAVVEKSMNNPRNYSKAQTDSVTAIILSGGAGTRLYPLTKTRAKPAVPLGGVYRLIDIPMSNCINSGLNKIYVLTQFNSTSLNRHLSQTYSTGRRAIGTEGFVEVLAAAQTPQADSWFRGTADAVRQYTWIFEDIKNRTIDDLLILAGDHLYRMEYMDFVMRHRELGADVTVGCLPCDAEKATSFGLMKTHEGRITEFKEKPKGDDLRSMRVDTSVLGLDPVEAKEKPFIASMGIYIYKKSAMIELLKQRFPDANDFGGEIIPGAAEIGMKVQAYLFNDYWEDIGTIRSFFEANLCLAQSPPNFEFYDPTYPIYTYPHFLPPANIFESKIVDAIISPGSTIGHGTVIENAIIGLRSTIGRNGDIRDAMVMGADYYESKARAAKIVAQGGLPIGIGDNTILRSVIIDKNARIGHSCKLINKEGVDEANRENEGFYIRSGIICVIRNSTIPSGSII
jgi:glucose-1-phosphate adenylyltransferase